MMTKVLRWIYAPVVPVLVLALAVSCGRKTDPLTPPSPRPEAVKDVKIATRDGVAFLSWAMPTRNVEGKEMNPADILGFRIYRGVLEPRKKARYKQIAEIELINPAPAEVRNGRVLWNDRNLHYGLVYGYRVRAVSAHGGLSQPSEEVRSAPLLSLGSPRRLQAVGGDGQIDLKWEPVTTRADGSAYAGFVGYNIYRGTEKGRQSETPLNKEPVTTTTYNDRSAVNDTVYYYVVRAVDSPTVPWKESLDSPEASAVARKLTPPKRPTGLTVVPGVGRIFLTWNENKESDLAGYHVYRSTKSGREYRRLTEKPIDRTTFSDEKVKPRVVYYYAVSAVDRSGNESALSKEQKAFAEKLR